MIISDFGLIKNFSSHNVPDVLREAYIPRAIYPHIFNTCDSGLASVRIIHMKVRKQFQ